MNLAVHGGAGLIEVGDSYTDDRHESVGKFDYVLANPKFNDTAFDAERVQDTRRFPHGSPTAKANYLWLQMCHSALGTGGRAAIVMPNSASDGSKKETAIRQAWVEGDVVEAVVAVGEKMFGSMTNPATLWFFNRAKKAHQQQHVLFIDARNTFTVIDGAHRRWTPEQIEFLGNIVRLWRGQEAHFDDGSRTMFEKQFPDSNYVDVAGLCGVASIQTIERQGWSVSPGRYVGSPRQELDDADFNEALAELAERFDELRLEAEDLASLTRRVLQAVLS